MRLTFLGTSAGAPTAARNVTAQAVSFDHGAVWILDCGEATQHRLLAAGLRPKAVECILITHLHGDHCYGLFGLFACLGIHGREDPVVVVGPRGVRAMCEAVWTASAARPHFPVQFHEWHDLPADGAGLGATAGSWSVTAFPIAHRLPCAGYLLREGPRPGRFYPERARAAGVPEGRDWGRLQAGHPVVVDGRTVQPSDVADPPRRGRVVLLLGDTSNADTMMSAGSGCDLAVREVTYGDELAEKAVRWGHSTAGDTGRWAAQLQAKQLVITHLSARYTDDPAAVAGLRQAVADRCPGTVVHAADDLWSIAIAPPDEPA
jgi:ribonuclease Z